MAAVTIEKLIVGMSDKPSSNKVTAASNAKKVFEQSPSTPLLNEKGRNHPIVVNSNKKNNNSLSVSTTNKPFRTNVSSNTANRALPSPLSVSKKNEKTNQPSGNLKRKYKNAASTATKPFQANETLPSSVINKIEIKQLSVVNTNLDCQDSSSVSTFQSNVALDATKETFPLPLSVMNKKQQQHEASVVSLKPATKIFRSAIVVSGDANKSSMTSSPAKKSKKPLPSSLENVICKKPKVVPATERSEKFCNILLPSILSIYFQFNIYAIAPIVPSIEHCEMVAVVKKLKEENAQLKSDREILTERNTALQIALVVCTKSIPQTPIFEEKVCNIKIATSHIFENSI